MKTVRSVLTLLIAAAVVPLKVWSGAELRSTVGTVEVKRAGSPTWSQGRPKTAVNNGDIVRTGVGSETEIKMNEGHKMTLRERTSLKVDSSQSPETKIDLLAGRVRTFVSKLKRQNKFEIKTPVAVASIRGTVFDLEVAESGASRLSVLEGVVSYRDIAGLGQEVQVLKGQSVLIEPGAAPRPAEPLPQDMQQGILPDEGARTAEFNAKAEVQREVGMAAFKEFFQTDAAQEMKTAQYQEGKTLIDAFGKRVRLEEYIARPAANQYSFVALNTREDRTDFTRFDLYAQNALPENISSINLFSGATNELTNQNNWVTKTHRLSSNGGDYYREWQDGGSPVNMNDNKQRVVFSHWYVEAKGQGAAPTLLSHWVPDAAYLGGNASATKTRDDAELQSILTQNIPSGYKNLGDGGTIGDVRPIDTAGFTDAQRLDALDNAAVNASYASSEGFARNSTVRFDDRTIAASTLAQILNSTKLSRVSVYDDPAVAGAVNHTLTVDQYYLNDEGDKLTFAQAAKLGSSVEGINFENVFTSSLIGNRKIDVVISPSIFKKAGLLDN
jgi:hypothetical protein